MHKLAKFVALHDQTPPHLLAHAKSMSLLDLAEIYKTTEHSKYTMDVIMTASDMMSTDRVDSPTPTHPVLPNSALCNISPP